MTILKEHIKRIVLKMRDGWNDFIAGTVAGFSGKVMDHPLDTVKVLLQTQQQNNNHRYQGTWDCIRHTMKTKGIMGFYAGLSTPLVGSMMENAVLFAAYSRFQQQLKILKHNNNDDELSLGELAMAGAGAGLVISFVLTPMELIKCRLQVQQPPQTTAASSIGPLQVLWDTLKTDGSRGLYRGHMSTMIREVFGNFCWYGTYESVCQACIPVGGTRDDLPTHVHLLGGATAGVAYWTFIFPADTIKSIIQTTTSVPSTSFRQTLTSITTTHGLLSLYNGWGITVTRAAPSHALVFATYEYIRKLLPPSTL